MKSFNLKLVKKHFLNLNAYSKNFDEIKKEISVIKKKPPIDKENTFLFDEFGKIFFPFINMGRIKSTDLFSANEFIIFFLYFCYKKYYSKKIKVADIGANIGLHSIIMEKIGFHVSSYEPDPKTFLQELSQQKSKKLPEYKLISKKGPSHSPIFTVNLNVLNLKKIVAQGSSIREAERKAANLALKLLNEKKIIKN